MIFASPKQSRLSVGNRRPERDPTTPKNLAVNPGLNLFCNSAKIDKGKNMRPAQEIYDKSPHDKIPHVKIPRVKSPYDKIPQRQNSP